MDIIEEIKDVYLKRNTEYGDSWRELAIRGVFAQLHNKFFRLRNKIKNPSVTKINLTDTLIDIINYSIIASFFLYKKKWNGESSEIELYDCIFDKIINKYFHAESSTDEQCFAVIEKQYYFLKDKVWENLKIDDEIENDIKIEKCIALSLLAIGSFSLIWLSGNTEKREV